MDATYSYDVFYPGTNDIVRADCMVPTASPRHLHLDLTSARQRTPAPPQDEE